MKSYLTADRLITDRNRSSYYPSHIVGEKKLPVAARILIIASLSAGLWWGISAFALSFFG